MNRKVSVMFVVLMAAAMLPTPLVATASAGKGEDKLDFNLVFIGSYMQPTWELITTNTAHYDLPFITLGPPIQTVGPPITLTVGSNTYPSNRLGYSGVLNLNENLKNGAETIRVEETITIFTDASKSVVMGTLVIQAIGNVEQGNGVGAGNNFIGFGTGAFAGVKVSGDTVGPVNVGTWHPIPTVTLPVLEVTRTGTAMGWP